MNIHLPSVIYKNNNRKWSSGNVEKSKENTVEHAISQFHTNTFKRYFYFNKRSAILNYFPKLKNFYPSGSHKDY